MFYNSDMKDLILVIDMQNAYEKGMPWECHSIERTKSNIIKLLSTGKDAVFTTFIASEHPKGAWKEYAEVNKDINEDKRANEIVPELLPYLKEHKLFYKDRYSSLSNNELRKLVAEYDRVVVTGVVAECCVLSTVFSLIDEGVPFLYIRDAVSGLNEKTESETEDILSGLVPVHGEIMNTDEYICSIFG